MRRKRGQAAMEFLMTYGWALLAIIIIGGLIWIYIGGRECGRVSTGFLGQNIAVEDWTVNENGATFVSIGNRAPNHVVIDSIEGISNPSGFECDSNGDGSFAETECTILKGAPPILVACPNPAGLTACNGVDPALGGGAAGSCYTERPLEIGYTVTGGTSHVVTGKISGSFES